MKIQNTLLFYGLFILIIFYFVVPEKEITGKPLCGKITDYDEMLLKNLVSSPLVQESEKNALSLKDLAVVTFTSLNHMAEAIRSCDTFQQHPQLKNVTFLMYLADDVPDEVQSQYKELCPVAKIIPLNLTSYPEYVKNLSQYRFKSIYTALALQNYKVVLNMDTSVRFVKDVNFEDLITTAAKRNPLDVTMLSNTRHNVYSTTHPLTFKCFPNIQPSKTIKMTEFQGGLVLWINTKNAWNIMEKLLRCALLKNCMGPIGATSKCNITLIKNYPEKFSGCHRFDQSVINLILFEAAGFKLADFQWQFPGLYVERGAKPV